MLKGYKTILRWLWRTSSGLRKQSAINIAVNILSVGLEFANVAVTKLAVDIATGRRSDWPLSWAAGLLICIMSTNVMINFSRRWIAAILGVKSQNRMQLRLFRHLMDSTWEGQESRHSGDVLNRLERDVQDVTSAITETVPNIIAVLVRLIGAVIFLYILDPRLACLMVVIFPSFIVVSKVYVRKMRTITREVRDTDSRIQSLLQESIQHRMVLKTLEQNQPMADQLFSLQSTLGEQIKHRTLFSSFSGLLFNAGVVAGYLTTFIWGVYRLSEGTITYGTMIAFIQLVAKIQGPFRDLTSYIPILVGCLTASERLMELEDAQLEEQGSPIKFPNGAGIRINDVSYTYAQGERQILSHFSFQFPIGSTTAILGETGAGKTTLIRLILALLEPQEGSVEMFDESHSVPVSPRTRCNLVYVPQGNTLFSGTIRQNLLMGNPDATDQQMNDALITACAEFVFDLPDGLDAPCGEQGAGLSEGQSQRISIARSLLRNGSILLLDEATSALDPDTERTLLYKLHNRANSRQTVICITHRPAVVEYCNQTLKLQRTARKNEKA